MAYKVDFQTVVDRVIRYSDIAQALQSATAGIDEGTVRLRLSEHEPDTLTQAASQIASYNDLETRIVKDFETLLGSLPTLSQRIPKLSFENLQSPNPPAAAGAAEVTAGTSTVAAVRLQPQILLDRLNTTLSQTVGGDATIMTMVREAVTKLELDTAEQRLNAAQTAADDSVFRVLLQYAIQIINDSSAAKLQQKIFVAPNQPDPGAEVTSGKALSEVFDSSTEIVTKAKTDLEGLVNSMKGGSIGIAGPRGIGKTTLLRSLCRTGAGEGDAKTLSIYTSAPVEYEARDFQLHVFSTLSLELLAKRGRRELRQGPFDEDEDRPRAGRQILFYAWAASRILIVAGGVVLLVGVLLAALLLRSAHQTPVVAVAAPKTPAGLAPLPSPRPTHLVSPSLTVSQTALGAAPAPTATLEPLRADLEDFGLRSGDFVRWGATALLLGLLIRYFYVRERDVEQRRFDERRRQSDDPDKLALEAQRALNKIRFQRSYSSGWSGALKVMPGAEVSVNEALSLVQNQETLPELVERFRKFVLLLTDEKNSLQSYDRIIIAIDELDKLESDEKAEQFLNDIKSIFSIPKCIYLVSVSESAISNFERRGIAFRDAFDSTFDDIYYVDYLSVDDSIKLLNQRVTNLPLTFGYICHALSAGLPRDLIRVARSMLQFARDNPMKNDIVSVTTALIERDVRSKVQALSIAARKVQVQPESSEFFIWLGGLSSRDLAIAARDSEQNVWSTRTTDVPDDDRADLALLCKSFRELVVFLGYAAALRALFTRAYARGASDSAAFLIMNSKWVDDLAKVRQGFETSFGTAQSRLDALKLQYHV